MEIREQIDRAIQKRKEKAQELTVQRQEISELLFALRESSDPERRALVPLAEELLAEYDPVIRRLSREHVSIALIGMAKQGKTQLLQTVSQLDRRVIEAICWTPFSGTTYFLVNDDTIPAGDFRATVTFREREALVRKVRELVSAIDPDYPAEEIEFEQIEYLPMTALKGRAGMEADKVIAFRFLKEIYENFFEISDCFGREPEVCTDPVRMNMLIGWNNGKLKWDPGYEAYRTYLAVRAVEVHCPFPWNMGKVRLIDTADYNYNWGPVEDWPALDTVARENDAAIVVTRPTSNPQEKDVEIYQELFNHFADKKPEKWLFYLVNHFKGQNDNTVDGFDRRISEWPMAGHGIADVSHEDEANRFLQSVLHTLMENLDEIDETYLQRLREKAAALHRSTERTEGGRRQTMEIKQQIDQIIRKRKEKAGELSLKRQAVSELRTALRKINALERQKAEIKNDDLRNEFILKFKGLELREAVTAAEELLKEYDLVIRRLSKDYISIATIGKERQGKSQFLQSVSQLDNRVIPAYSGASCTGATSVIRNDDTLPQGSLSARITYKKRSDLLKLIWEYISEIDPAYPVDEIEFEQIEYLPMTALKEKAGSEAKKVTAFRHLNEIYENFIEIGDFFDKEPETYTDPEEIKRLVAQNNGKGEGDPEYEAYHRYLAVARADISCRFYNDAGKVRLIDTIGIEATMAGVEQAMLDTVKYESDAAIVVTRPTSNPQEKDVEIYQELFSHFADKRPEKWLFYLVNHFKGQNDNTVEGFDKSISEWGMAGHMIVDCSDREAVNNRFMKSVLNTLLANIDEIDGVYLQQLGEKDAKMRTRINDLIRYIDGLTTHKRDGRLALERGKECFNAIGTQLKKIVYHYYHEANEPNTILWNETQKILRTLDSEIVPSKEAIQAIADKNNVLGIDVWNTMLHYIRNEITRRFVQIDDELARENIRFKNSLVKVFYDNLTQLFGKSEDVNDDSVDMTKKLRGLLEVITAGDKKYAQIYEAVVFLDNFTFNTRATIIQTVRSQLGIINPLSEDYASPRAEFHPINCGAEIQYYLTSRLSLIEENLRHALMGIYSTPNKAFYAVAEEFYDKLTFAATDISDGRITSMSDVWGAFFQAYSDMIWSDEAKQSEVLNTLIQNIKDLRPLLEKCLA